MKPQLKIVKPVERYKLFIQFSDGTEGVLNLDHLSGKGVFKAWDKDNFFFEVFISESGVITWPGEIDIDTYNVKDKRHYSPTIFQYNFSSCPASLVSSE